MIKQNLLPVPMQTALRSTMNKARKVSRNPWFRGFSFIVFIYLIHKIELNVHFSFGSSAPNVSIAGPTANFSAQEDAPERGPEPLATEMPRPKALAVKESTVQAGAGQTIWWKEIRDQSGDLESRLNLANAATAVGAALSPEEQAQALRFSNLGFILNPGLAERKGIDPRVVAMKNQIVYDYINKYAKTAQEEARIFNIPAAITLAQGLLESNAGGSRLASRDNNHFGIKCKAKCLGCRCANYTDDSRYDMFRVFDSAWHSFREHSKLLSGARYAHLKKLDLQDYKSWAHGLKKAGYATDARYGEKLIQIIEALELQKYDL